MQKKINLQDLFLLRARQDRVPVTLFLMNGFQMRGTITGYDPFVVVLTAMDASRSSTSTPSPPLPPSDRWSCGRMRREPPCKTHTRRYEKQFSHQ